MRTLRVLAQVHVETPLATDGAGVVQGMAVGLARTRLGSPEGGLVQIQCERWGAGLTVPGGPLRLARPGELVSACLMGADGISVQLKVLHALV